MRKARRFRIGAPLSAAMWIAGLLVIGAGIRLVVRTAASAICGSSNFISNDFCDEWRFDNPPAGASPVPIWLPPLAKVRNGTAAPHRPGYAE